MSVRAQVRVDAFLFRSLLRFFLFNHVSLTQRDESQHIEVRYRVPVSGRFVSRLNSSFSSQC